jgi:hypothetical protein
MARAGKDQAPWTANRGAQARSVKDWRHRFVGFAGGWGSGKTWAGARKLICLHFHNGIDGDGRPTLVPSVAGAPSYRLAHDVVVPALEDALNDAGIPFRYDNKHERFIIPWLSTQRKPSVIMVRSADSAERIAGWQVGAMWLDEPTRFRECWDDPKRDPLIQFMGRLRHERARFQQAILTFTHEGDHTRVYHFLTEQGKPDRVIYTGATTENPQAPLEYIDFLESLPDHLRRQYLHGEAVSLRGQLVYPTFDEARNVDDTLQLTHKLPLQVAIDFNISPGMHAEIGQYDQANDLLYVTHEIHERDMDVRNMMHALRALIESLGGWQWPELHIFGDASGQGRWAGTGETEYDIIRELLDAWGVPYRLRVPSGNPPVVDRVNAYNVALLDLHGQPHWRCHPRCERLIADLKRMRRDNAGEIDKSNRELSHASDAEGYRVWYLRPVRTPPKTANQVNV